MKIKKSNVIHFLPGTDFEGSGWHIASDPSGDDRTLCGLAWEGLCANPLPAEKRFKSKQGRPTCANCLRIIEAVAALILPAKPATGGREG